MGSVKCNINFYNDSELFGHILSSENYFDYVLSKDVLTNKS